TPRPRRFSVFHLFPREPRCRSESGDIYSWLTLFACCSRVSASAHRRGVRKALLRAAFQIALQQLVRQDARGRGIMLSPDGGPSIPGRAVAFPEILRGRNRIARSGSLPPCRILRKAAPDDRARVRRPPAESTSLCARSY